MDSNDALSYLKASTLATILSVAVVTYMYRFVDFSKGAFLILGDIQRLESLAGKYKLDGLLISFNHSDHVKLDEIKRLCRANGLFLKQFSVSFKDVDPAL